MYEQDSCPKIVRYMSKISVCYFKTVLTYVNIVLSRIISVGKNICHVANKNDIFYISRTKKH